MRDEAGLREIKTVALPEKTLSSLPIIGQLTSSLALEIGRLKLKKLAQSHSFIRFRYA
jgi:hypothetical protein